MEQNVIDKICKQIYKRFPPLKENPPRVSKQSEGRYLLVFSSSGRTPDGKSVQQTVRVVATEDGKIIKTSMSR